MKTEETLAFLTELPDPAAVGATQHDTRGVTRPDDLPVKVCFNRRLPVPGTVNEVRQTCSEQMEEKDTFSTQIDIRKTSKTLSVLIGIPVESERQNDRRVPRTRQPHVYPSCPEIIAGGRAMSWTNRQTHIAT